MLASNQGVQPFGLPCEAQLQKVPYMLVVGDREAEAGQVAVRNRKHGDLGAVPVDEFLKKLTGLVESRSLEE